MIFILRYLVNTPDCFFYRSYFLIISIGCLSLAVSHELLGEIFPLSHHFFPRLLLWFHLDFPYTDDRLNFKNFPAANGCYCVRYRLRKPGRKPK